MSSSQPALARVVPAHLDFLAIYNPSLGSKEQIEKDQIVFYWSSSSDSRNVDLDSGDTADNISKEKSNEELRQVGLAQGIIHFAKDFSNGSPVESIDTEKHRIVLQELEEGWWILASINLTVLPYHSRSAPGVETLNSPAVEHSAREVSPPALLLSQLKSAHSIFQLHHGTSLSRLYERVRRVKLCNLLKIYWSTFAMNWDVMLHGNPAVEIYNGIKLAAGGELGVGVGEEEWGSGEREVLEGIIRDEDGLLDLLVSRYGHAAQGNPTHTTEKPSTQQAHDELQEQWLGTLAQPDSTDGIIFSGAGAISRASFQTLAAWISTIYAYGEGAYGIRDNPTSGRQRGLTGLGNSSSASVARKQGDIPSNPATIYNQVGATPVDRQDAKLHESASNTLVADDMSVRATASDDNSRQNENQMKSPGPTIPRPIVSAAENALKQATEQLDKADKQHQEQKNDAFRAEPDGWTKYLTLGYGSSWTIPGLQKSSSTPTTNDANKYLQALGDANAKDVNDRRVKPKADFQPPSLQISDTVGSDPSSSGGRFLIGLTGSLDQPEVNDISDADANDSGISEDDDPNSRLVIRTVHVGVIVPDRARRSASSTSSSRLEASTMGSNASANTTIEVRRLRVVVYIHRPFIFTFLFQPSSQCLSMPSFFRKLHKTLLPLHRPLLASTSPSNVASRLSSSLVVPTSYHTNARSADSPILDLVYDPYNLTVHTSIPNIPLPGTLVAEGLHIPTGKSPKTSALPWTRAEALNVHAQILNAFGETRHEGGACDLQTKTSRGWWIVWMRLTAAADGTASPLDHAGRDCGEGFREAVLIRRASDHVAVPHSSDKAGHRITSGMLGRWTRENNGGLAKIGGSDDISESSMGFGWAPGRITEGLGVDARKYVESLLSLNR